MKFAWELVHLKTHFSKHIYSAFYYAFYTQVCKLQYFNLPESQHINLDYWFTCCIILAAPPTEGRQIGLPLVPVPPLTVPVRVRVRNDIYFKISPRVLNLGLSY